MFSSKEAQMNLLIVLPCLNEAKTIADIIDAMPSTIKGIRQISTLVVDDGSTDNSADVAREHGALVLSHGYVRGVGCAFKTAINYAISNHFDIMVNIDSDGQFSPIDIPLLVEPILNNEADFVTASRFKDSKMLPNIPLIKLWGNRFIARLVSHLARRKFYDVSCGFRAYSRETLLRLNLHGRFTYTQETFLDLSFKGLRITEIPIKVQYFDKRKSRVAGNIFKYALNSMIIIFRSFRDHHQMRFFWSISLFFLFLGTAFGSILVIHYVQTNQFSGQIWAGYVSGFMYMVSISFLILGIAMDMLVRLKAELNEVLYLLKKQMR